MKGKKFRPNNLLKLKVCLLYFNVQASRQHGWNVTVGNVSSTVVDVSWFPLNTKSSDSAYIYGYVAALHLLRNGTGDILLLNVANASFWNTSSSSLNTVVSGLRPYTKYQVNVVALLRDRVTGAISLRRSESTEIQTPEGGE